MARSQNQAERLLEAYQPIRNWSVPEPDISARSASIIEVYPSGAVKTLLAKNVDHPYPIASITKLMTAMVSVDLYDLNRTTIISWSAANQIDTGVLREGDQLTVRDLIYLILMESNNGAAHALAEIQGAPSFIREMNRKASSLGLNQTSFVTASGLTGINQTENYSTARELTKMSIHLWEQEEYRVIQEALMAESHPIYDGTGVFYHRAFNNNQLLDQYRSLVGGKTGFLPAADQCLLSVFKRNQLEDVYLVVVILGSNDRFVDTMTVVEWLPMAYLYSYDYGL